MFLLHPDDLTVLRPAKRGLEEEERESKRSGDDGRTNNNACCPPPSQPQPPRGLEDDDEKRVEILPRAQFVSRRSLVRREHPTPYNIITPRKREGDREIEREEGKINTRLRSKEGSLCEPSVHYNIRRGEGQHQRSFRRQKQEIVYRKKKKKEEEESEVTTQLARDRPASSTVAVKLFNARRTLHTYSWCRVRTY